MNVLFHRQVLNDCQQFLWRIIDSTKKAIAGSTKQSPHSSGAMAMVNYKSTWHSLTYSTYARLSVFHSLVIIDRHVVLATQSVLGYIFALLSGASHSLVAIPAALFYRFLIEPVVFGFLFKYGLFFFRVISLIYKFNVVWILQSIAARIRSRAQLTARLSLLLRFDFPTEIFFGFV